jgi:alpha-aminoadipic semialdehyde synthase
MAPIDIFAYLLAHKLQYKPHERDMVILSHEIIAKAREPSSYGREQGHEEVYTSSLMTYGTPKASAMAQTVGLPVAIAALNVLDGKVDVRGVVGPSEPCIYKPVLRGLEEAGLGMVESARTGGDTLEERLVASFN